MKINDSNFKKNIKNIIQTPIKATDDTTIAWNTDIYNQQNELLAGGVSEDKDTSLRIAYSEFIERILFRYIVQNRDLANYFKMVDFPTSCGFAAGFDDNPTKNRSLCEAIERWCWNMWIDEQIYIPSIKFNFKGDYIEKMTRGAFVKIDYRVINLPPIIFEKTKLTNLYFCAAIAKTENGVFLGSRVSDNFLDLFRHSTLEAYRANLIFNNKSPNAKRSDNFFYSRLNYWGNNLKCMPNIDEFRRVQFPNPEIDICVKLEGLKDIFLYRTLIKNFKSWHVGNEDRFIY